MYQFSNRSQMMSNCGMNKRGEGRAQEVRPSVSLMFFQQFDLFCDLLNSTYHVKLF